MSCGSGSPSVLICWINRLYHHVEHIIRRLIIVKKNYRENKQEYFSNFNLKINCSSRCYGRKALKHKMIAEFFYVNHVCATAVDSSKQEKKQSKTQPKKPQTSLLIHVRSFLSLKPAQFLRGNGYFFVGAMNSNREKLITYSCCLNKWISSKSTW